MLNLLSDPLISPFSRAIRRIAGAVEKIAFLLARRAFIRRRIRLQGIAAFLTFPTGHIPTSSHFITMEGFTPSMVNRSD